MIVPIENIVENVNLTARDALLPIYECVVNSIISLKQVDLPNKEIQVKIIRGNYPNQPTLENLKTIEDVIITDNGVGFTEKNLKSFETPFSKTNKEYGCKGVGRFTVLAAFKKMCVKSNYVELDQWKYREFECDSENEITPITFKNSIDQELKTQVHLIDCFNQIVKDKTAVSVHVIAEEIMRHCLIYYLSGDLPIIKVFDQENEQLAIVNELFDKVSKDNERTFEIEGVQFKAYITKTLKEGNRKNHYSYLCANSRVVGQPYNISKVNTLFSFPVLIDSKYYFLDVYVVSEYLNKHVYNARNGFSIPISVENRLFDFSDLVSIEEIERKLAEVLTDEYQSFVKDTIDRNEKTIKQYVAEKAPRYQNLIKDNNVIKSIPPNLSEDKLEEHLYRASFQARKSIEKKVQDFIEDKQVNEETIETIKRDIKEKTAYDADSLADYMMRRKAIIELFDKFLEADREGRYKLEQDIHNLIFPMGVTNDEVSYESHNLWLLDERFLTYKFVASDKAITSFTQKKSGKEPDIVLMQEAPQMFDNPISFGDRSSGDLNSMVVFEFKRPGEVAHQKKKSDYLWEFSDLIEPYFDEFLYKPDKKNYKGKHVIVRKETPKFGYIIVDVLPQQLEQFNIDKGWQKTPFGTFYKMVSGKNLHIEVMTFSKLLEYAKNRHSPFFDKLFG